MIDPTSDRAQYRQIADTLREAILSGALPEGAALPSEERLRQEHDVSRTTVRNAINLLKSEGLVVVEAPRGTFARRAQPTVVVPLGKGDSATSRMPTPTERKQQDVPEGIPVLVVKRADGAVELHPGNRTRLESGS